MLLLVVAACYWAGKRNNDNDVRIGPQDSSTKNLAENDYNSVIQQTAVS